MDTKNIISKIYGPVKYEVGREKIMEYAMAVNDLNPIYLKDEEAIKAGFKSIVAPPLFSVVYTWKIVEMVLRDPDLALNLAMFVHREQSFDFVELVYPGDVISTEGKIIDFYTKTGFQFFTLETTSFRNTAIIAKGISTFVVRRR
ncbi:MAG TPA: MaoC family dehydratase N-terminal domain-containing protein [bacterium]